MRKGLDGLTSRHPLATALPALMQDDDFTTRWVAGLDDVVAPLMWTLDSLESYFDPLLAPPDFVDWLGGWVGAADADGMDEETRRALVAETATLYGMRGTVQGLRRFLQLTTEVVVTSIDDGGGITWTRDPSRSSAAMSGRPVLVVTIVGDDAEVDAVRKLVAAWCPAHIGVRVEVDRS